MPVYDYVCKTCGLEFEEILPINRREEPVGKAPCNHCEQVEAQCEIVMKVAAPYFGDPWHFSSKSGKVDRGFKDRLTEIKKNYPNSNMSIPP